MKYSTGLLIVAPAIGLATVAILFLRQDETPVTPSAWIVDAAVALNRDSIAANPHGAMQDIGNDASAVRSAVQRGQHLRVQRRFAEAADAFREAVRADPADADSWADLADCMAAAKDNDLTGSRDAILHAIAIDPRHRKALWLRASLELQEQRYDAAAATWRELLPLVAADSTDAKVIAANIVEADSLARDTKPSVGRDG